MKTKKGLTLVELLIVIAIVALLAGIAYSVLAPIRERARQTACMSNLKQIGIALHLYAHDWNDFVPPYHNDRFIYDAGGIKTKDRFLPIDPRLYNPELAVAAIDRYVRNKGVWFCPCDIWKGKDYPLNPNPKESDPPGPVFAPRNRVFTSYAIRPENSLFAPVSIHFQPRFPEEVFPPDVLLGGELAMPYTDAYWVHDTWYAECANHWEHDQISITTVKYSHEYGRGKISVKGALILMLKFDGRVIWGRRSVFHGSGIAPLP